MQKRFKKLALALALVLSFQVLAPAPRAEAAIVSAAAFTTGIVTNNDFLVRTIFYVGFAAIVAAGLTLSMKFFGGNSETVALVLALPESEFERELATALPFLRLSEREDFIDLANEKVAKGDFIKTGRIYRKDLEEIIISISKEEVNDILSMGVYSSAQEKRVNALLN